jgi:hypothetical protein
MAHNFTSKLRQMRIAAMTWMWARILDHSPDPCGTGAQHDHATCEEHGLFDIVGYQKRAEACAVNRADLMAHRE